MKRMCFFPLAMKSLVILITVTLFLAEARYHSPKNISRRPAVASRILGLSGQVCFKRLGCFDQNEKWVHTSRPIPLPEDPEEIKTKLYLCTRQTPFVDVSKTVLLWPEISLEGTDYNPELWSTFIIHGFSTDAIEAKWPIELKTEYLKKVESNIFLVDWSGGADIANYLQAAGNTRVVGAELARFAEHLVTNLNQNADMIHCIGHSLGAHICGVFRNLMKTKHNKTIEWITGLDPAGPGFQGEDDITRLDKTDASFVDAMHTDAKHLITLGFGNHDATAHVDFFVNGGSYQKRCAPFSKKNWAENITRDQPLSWFKYPLKEIADWFTCPHSRATEYYISSFNECLFIGYRSERKAIGNAQTREECQFETECQIMGLLSRIAIGRGTFYVPVTEEPPYCAPRGYLLERERTFMDHVVRLYKKITPFGRLLVAMGILPE